MAPLLLALLGACSSPPAPVALAVTPPPATGAAHLPLQRFLWPGPKLPASVKPDHALCQVARGEELPLPTVKQGLDEGWLQLGLVEVAGERLKLGGADLAAMPAGDSANGAALVVPELEARLKSVIDGIDLVNAACGAKWEPQLALLAGGEASTLDGLTPVYTAGKVGFHDIWIVVDQPGAPAWTPLKAWKGPPQEYMTIFEDTAGVRLISAHPEVAPAGPVQRELLGSLLGGDAQGPQVCLILSLRPEAPWSDAVGLADVAHRAGARDLLPAVTTRLQSRPPPRSAPTPGPALDWSAGLSALSLSLPTYSMPGTGDPDQILSPSGSCRVDTGRHEAEVEMKTSPAE